MLREAITALAEKLNMTVTDKVKDWYGNPTRCTVALTGTGLSNGIGFTADKDGNVEVVGDSYRQYRYSDVAETAKNFINAFQVAAKARQQNPFTTTKITLKDRKAILEVSIP